MKSIILLLFVILGFSLSAWSQTTENVTLRTGQQRSAAGGKLKVKFLSVVEDSRCPVGKTCVWAGNAKVKIELSRGHNAPMTFELNTGLNPRSVEFDGYEIGLISLTPEPGENTKANGSRSTITLSVKRL